MRKLDYYPHAVRRFVFNGMPLLPATGHDTWRLPEGRVANTKELYDLAKARGMSAYTFIREEIAI